MFPEPAKLSNAHNSIGLAHQYTPDFHNKSQFLVSLDNIVERQFLSSFHHGCNEREVGFLPLEQIRLYLLERKGLSEKGRSLRWDWCNCEIGF